MLANCRQGKTIINTISQNFCARRDSHPFTTAALRKFLRCSVQGSNLNPQASLRRRGAILEMLSITLTAQKFGVSVGFLPMYSLGVPKAVFTIKLPETVNFLECGLEPLLAAPRFGCAPVVLPRDLPQTHACVAGVFDLRRGENISVK